MTPIPCSTEPFPLRTARQTPRGWMILVPKSSSALSFLCHKNSHKPSITTFPILLQIPPGPNQTQLATLGPFQGPNRWDSPFSTVSTPSCPLSTTYPSEKQNGFAITTDHEHGQNLDPGPRALDSSHYDHDNLAHHLCDFSGPWYVHVNHIDHADHVYRADHAYADRCPPTDAHNYRIHHDTG